MKEKIGLNNAISIGIGGMVGGGIFAVLGLAVSLAKGGTPVAFFLAGIIAIFTAGSYARLSRLYPDRGGTVRFINQGFGKTVFSGGINNLLWISYIIMLALYASAFGSYAPNLYSITGDKSKDFHLYASGIILLATAINYYSIKVVSKIESYAVIVKLLILTGFVVIGIYGLFGENHLDQLQFRNWKDPINLLTGGMVIFVAYEGFELIANAVPDLENPEKNVNRAYFYSVIFVMILYILIAGVTVGSLTFSKISSAQDYVLAEAAKPQLGQWGFSIITIAALISTFSAINATLYGGSRVSYVIAESDELPHELTGKLWNQPIGLMISAVLTLLLVNMLKLESISTAGSVGFLLIFSMVNYVAFKFAKEMNTNPVSSLIGTILSASATIVLTIQQFGSNPVGIIIAWSVIAICFFLEWIYKDFWETKNSS